MSGERIKRIIDRINENLSEQTNTTYMRGNIFKVHDSQRSENKQAYEPKILSIGPYHHGKRNLRQMETYKLWHVQQLLSRIERSGNALIDVITNVEDEARKCYADEIKLWDEEFAEMLFVDSCFIIEFLSNWHGSQPWDKDDLIMDMDRLHNNIARDLILFENQVPLFVLIALCKITGDNLFALALNLCRLMPDWLSTARNCTGISPNEVIHLLDFVHKIWCSSFVAALPADLEHGYSLWFLNSASELKQRGIKFGSGMENKSWLDITFIKGRIIIPPLTVTNDTESIFRNLIAYEQHETNPRSTRCVSDYANFLDRLIDSPRDVETLRRHGIIINMLGDDEVVSTMFNKLGNVAIISGWKFCYKKVIMDVYAYSNSRRAFLFWKKWMTQRMQNYFNSPWYIFSFLAAIVLLILTSVQTIFSILQYVKQ